MERDGKGRHSRVFSYFLHPEMDFVGVGKSQEVIDGKAPHPEHVVPCIVLINESCRLLKEGVPETEVARLLSKHWKIVLISKEEAGRLDSKDGTGLKCRMPENWRFESGDTYERLKQAGIKWLPLEI